MLQLTQQRSSKQQTIKIIQIGLIETLNVKRKCLRIHNFSQKRGPAET
jgi:hypothetical protein